MTPEQLLPHLPRLRRYARMLTGDQSAGDATVEIVLKRLLSRRSAGQPNLPLRTRLYKTLNEILADYRHLHLADSKASPVAGRLMAMHPVSREVFLLVHVEEFSLIEAAEILGLTPSEVARKLDAAGAEIAGQIATNVLVIEDEPLIALTIESLVRELGHSVVGVASTKSQAVGLAHKHRPGLVLADIQLADGSSGLDAVREITIEYPVPAIFITAFPERLLTGTKPEPAFLITKPFESDQVKAVVSQTLFFRR